ncbi:hypothetical protein, partial [Burkholderia cenocepacia]|uniref:hypothetical protein n=1 Tax=Burkholderia cenocepacia TaxID=95486 RepID=UPI001C0E45A9
LERLRAGLALPRLHHLVDGLLLRVDLLLELLRFVEALARGRIVLLALQLRDLRFAFLNGDRARRRARSPFRKAKRRSRN